MDPTIQQSLQEIASLLLIVHDDYLKGVSGADVLSALAELIDDVGLTQQVSILDAERLRRTVMQDNESDMGYELFYDWLRGVGQLVSSDRDVGGKKALHYLLTQYIIPFASTLGTRSGSDGIVHSLPYYDGSALRIMSDFDSFFFLWFHDLVHQVPASVLSANHSIWSQICAQGSPQVDFLALIGNFTKYSVVPDVVTDDQAESILLLAMNDSSGNLEGALSFPGFLHYLELLAQAVPEHKLPLHMRGGGAAAVPKLQVLLVYLGDCMLQRRAFEYAFVASAGGADHDAIDVFDEERLQEGGISDNSILRWLRSAGTIHIPHVQIPIVAQCLSVLADARSEVVLVQGADASQRLWRASEISTVLYAVVKQLTSFSTPAPVSRVHEVLYLMGQVPGVFFNSPATRDSAGAPTAATGSLYSVWTAPLLQDAVEDINASLNQLWLALGDGENGPPGDARRSDNFTATFGNARTRIHRVVHLLTDAGLVPSILSTEQLVKICGAVQGERLPSANDEVSISQGRLFDTLYTVAHEHWHALENWRRKRSLDAPPSKLSSRQPQREQQVFQVFTYLLELRFPTTEPSVPPIPIQVQTTAAVPPSTEGKESSEGRRSTQVGDDVLRSPPPRTALQIISDMIHQDPSAQPTPQRSQPAQPLMVSFNSNLHVDGSPIRNGHSDSPPLPRSFFADHPLRDIAVLLTHYPVPGFALAPWTMLELLRSNSEAFPATGYGDPSANTDALLTSLLSRFCLRFHVSSNDLSQFFASYYLTAETNSIEARAKEQALRSPVMDFLMADETIPALAEQADLLKWEYARCYAQCRATGDPFLDSVAVPLLTNIDFERHPAVERLSVGHLRNWAAQRTALRQEEVEEHITQIACLSATGDRGVTFSTFVLFAARCFSHALWAGGATTVSELTFRSALDQMLDAFRSQLKQVEDSLKMEVMQPLFGDIEDLAILPPESSGRVATAALEQFAAAITILAPGTVMVSSGPTTAMPGDGRIPPRPPKILWDAPRFAQFCRDLGVLVGWNVSVTSAWSVFGLLLRQEDAPGLASWADGVVPPIPLRASSDLVRKLLSAMTTDTMGTVHLLHKTVVPVMCATVLSLAVNPGKAAQDGLRSEDLLRYGGSAVARSLQSSQDQLQRVYASLCEESAPLLRTLDVEDSAKHQPEVALSVLCRSLALSGLLRAPAVAMQVKRSLHTRLRPGYRAVTAVPSQGSPEVATISYPEFEEVVLRVAFLLWEVSTAHAHSEHEASEAVLLAQAHLQAGGPSKEVAAVASAYTAACSTSSTAARQTAASSSLRSAWGVDFLGPYLTALERSMEEKRQLKSGIAQSEPDPLRRSKGSVRFGRDVVLNESEAASLGLTENKEEDARPPIARKSNSFTGLPGDVFSSPTIDLTTRSPSPTGALRSASNSRNTPSPLSDAAWRERDRPGSTSASPKMQPSQRIIQSSTERFLQRQESSEQFVVAVDSLVNGTKEALWPVYATYCSCGDSLDPGKLSGPNLFTLLSKLGVLTDRTSLSDVGILLHQTAAHTLTGPSANAVAMLYESGEYFEAPSLTFEEFLVFLCAFSQLRYKGEMLTPETFHMASGGGLNGPGPNSGPDRWFKRWQDFMYRSNAFRHLLGERILPVLQRQMLLAFPEDARLRDRFCCVFSVEVLIAIEGVEEPLSRFFETERTRELSLSQQAASSDVEISAIITALKRINLIPNVMGEPHVLQLIQDVLPEQPSKRRTAAAAGSGQDRTGTGTTHRKPALLFPQWEWVLSVVAFQAVVAATEQSAAPTEAEKIPGMVADVISSIASAITQQR